jgi:hypothetical protein
LRQIGDALRGAVPVVAVVRQPLRFKQDLLGADHWMALLLELVEAVGERF